MSNLSPVLEFLTGAQAAAERLGYGDPALRDAYERQIMMILAGGFVEVFGGQPEAPTWLPFFPYYLSRSAPNPDTVMGFCGIDAKGVYRISGVKGTETISTVTVRDGGAHVGKRPGKRLGSDEIDLLVLPQDAAGRYEFILSAERPKGYDGVWFKLDPAATMLTKRHVTKTADQVDGTCMIERLDKLPGPVRPVPGEMADKFKLLAKFCAEQNEFLMGYVNYLRERGAEEKPILDDQTAYGGLIVQAYYFYLFELGEDEAIILESVVPEAKYWNIQIWDPFCTTLDYVSRQTALNSEQLQVDSDGRVRVVIARRDPGVANWLDTSGWDKGGLIWRWNDAESSPDPTATKVKLEDLAERLPKDTVWADADFRREALRQRAILYQNRRK